MEREINRFRLFIAACFLVLLVTGCVPSEPPPSEESEKVFYPEPPEPPRYQYLRSYVGSVDFTKVQSSFDAFVVGRQGGGLRLDKPYGVTALPGKFYVADSNFSVFKFDLQAGNFQPLQGAKGLGKLIQPINITKDKNGNKYVVDPIRKQVFQYDAKDYYIKSYRFKKDWKPVDVELYKNYLYVCDGKNRQVHYFDIESAELLGSFGQEGAPDERMGLPLNLAISPDGTLTISDAGRIQLLTYDLDGHFLGTIGEAGSSPGFFARPRGVAIDKDGRIYVVDAAFDNVQVFHKTGQLLTFFGGPGDKPGSLQLPAGIEIDYDNIDLFKEYLDPNFVPEYLVYVISQFGDRLVNVYAYGKQKGVEYKTFDDLLELRQQQLRELKGSN